MEGDGRRWKEREGEGREGRRGRGGGRRRKKGKERLFFAPKRKGISPSHHSDYHHHIHINTLISMTTTTTNNKDLRHVPTTTSPLPHDHSSPPKGRQ